jgi:hypothetical protein
METKNKTDQASEQDDSKKEEKNASECSESKDKTATDDKIKFEKDFEFEEGKEPLLDSNTEKMDSTMYTQMTQNANDAPIVAQIIEPATNPEMDGTPEKESND